MHPNPAFRQTPDARNIAFARDTGFGMLALSKPGAPLVSHLPFLLSGDGASVEFHLVRSNPIIRVLRDGPAMARLAVVGSNETTAPVIEASYRRLLGLLDAHLTGHRFVMGGRPGTADLGLYGQLTQLVAFDPTPSALALEEAPRVVAWVDGVEDLSGVEPREEDWLRRDALPETFRALLAEIGRVYVPFLRANAAALADGAEEVRCEIDGRPWRQRPFTYQGKCLRALREAHAALAPGDRKGVDAALDGTGCEALFEADAGGA